MPRKNLKRKVIAKSTKHKTNQVRIIGGHLKRRNVDFVDADGLRPTPDRLRETIFNWLTASIFNARVLDVCAGSGVLSFEALSRGAIHATLIEPNAAQANKIKCNADIFKFTNNNINVINATAQTALPTLNTPFDIIFIDPPYNLNIWQEIVSGIIENQLHHADTLFYIEGDKPLNEMLSPFTVELIKNSKVGQVHAGIFRLQS